MNRMRSLGAASVLIVIVAAGVLLFGPTSCSLGPPQVTPKEAYAREGSATFDHGVFAGVLQKHVSQDGLVKYEALARDHAGLDRYLEQLAAAPFDDLGRDDKLAFLINAYNACTLRLILDHLPLDSIKDIPADERWQGRRWKIGGRDLTLHEIEHDECRAKFEEPRVHFALNCASRSCPPLRSEPYRGVDLEAQLADQAWTFVSDTRWCQVDEQKREVKLSKIFDWYESDFLTEAGSLASYFAALRRNEKFADYEDYSFLDYDWSLNITR